MNAIRIVLCLTSRDNDYQRQQAQESERAAQSLGIQLTIVDGDNDAISQSQRLLSIIQGKAQKPDAILFEPVSASGLPHVAKAAVAAGIGWGVLNRDVDYMADLHKQSSVAVFGIGPDQVEVGRIQAAQLKTLLPEGGEVLLIEGPSENAAARQRTEGFVEKKGPGVLIKHLKAKWTEASGKDAVSAWLRLSTSHQTHIKAVVAHNDDMAMGARKALGMLEGIERDHYSRIPYLGVDGLPKAGQVWISRGMLTATVLVPLTGPPAIEAFVRAARSGTRPPVWTNVAPVSFPELGKLAASV